jgi:hypothetical protein
MHLQKSTSRAMKRLDEKEHIVVITKPLDACIDFRRIAL